MTKANEPAARPSKDEIIFLLARRIRNYWPGTDGWLTIEVEDLAKWLIHSKHVTYETMFDHPAELAKGDAE